MTDNNAAQWEDSYHLLIVDDEEIHRKLEREIFRKTEFDVVEAKDGDEALYYIKKYDFDVVLLDKNMPGIDGDEVCYHVRHEYSMPLLPLIMVTGSTQSEELEKSMMAGANDFIRKPYTPMELLARVRSAANHKRITDQLDNMESILFALARMVEAKDKYTGEHCSRLEHMAVVFGEELGLQPYDLLALRRGGVLHDIGKLGIPDSILLKKGPLTDDEWEIMRKHPEIGSNLCNGLKSMKMTLPIIRHHHERWDGGGYPDGLVGNDIPYLARVFQIIDIYDALISERPYKDALSVDEAAEILRKETKNNLLDPELVSVFLKILHDRPDDLQLSDKTEKELGKETFDEIIAARTLD